MTRFTKLLLPLVAVLLLAWVGTALSQTNIGGVFVTTRNYLITGQWTWQNANPFVFRGSASGPFTNTFGVTTPTANRTWTLPDLSGGNFVGTSGTQTLTNKTITAPVFTGSVTGTYTLAGTPTYTEKVNASGAGTVALTAAQSGQMFLFDAATGIVYTLPVPTAGLYYDFVVSVTDTSNIHEIDTSSGAVFIQGTTEMATEGATPSGTIGPKWFSCNGSTHVKFKMAAASTNATGGLQGTQIRFTALDATHWQVTGTVLAGVGATIATPCST